MSVNLIGDFHSKVIGATGRGKSGLLQLSARAIIKAGHDGLLGIDPHGEFVRAVFEWASNPHNVNLHGRRLEFLDPAGDRCFGLNPLRPRDSSREAAFAAAMTLVNTVEAFFDESATDTPRLLRIIFVTAFACALKGLTVREMVEMLSLGGEAIRSAAMQDLSGLLAGREIEELSILTASPARFAETTESARNRFVVLLSDDRVMRILANSRSIDPTVAMDNRELLLADFSALPASSARFLGALITTMFVTAALRRRPHYCAPFRLMLDEGENIITSQIARMIDQCRKFKFYLSPVAIQWLGQLRKRGPEITDSIFTNCTTTVCFGIGNDPEAATFMADSLLSPFNLEKWKRSSIRPTAVGSNEVLVQSRSHSQSHSREQSRSRGTQVAKHESTGEAIGRATSHGIADTKGRSNSLGWARNRAVATTDGESYGVGSVNAAALGRTDADTSGWSKAQGANTGTGNTESLQLTPPDLGFFPDAPTPIGQGTAVTQQSGTSAMSAQMGGHMSGTSSVFSSADSEQSGWMNATTLSEGEGESGAETESEARTVSSSRSKTFAHSRARGTSRGHSETTGESHGETHDVTLGESQSFITRYELLPSQYFSLDEIRHLLMAELMGLPRRHCVVKIDTAPAFRTRTVDLTPAYKSAYFKSLMVPLFTKGMIARSPYLRPITEVDDEIAARFKNAIRPPAQPEPDLATPQSIKAAASNLKRKPRARRASGANLTVIDGKTSSNGDNEPGSEQ